MATVLFVDDEGAIRTLFKTMLELEGFEVVTADSASAALALLKTAHFELVITDLRMESPNSGFEVVREAAAQDPRPPIIVLTAYPVPKSDWTKAGADALLMKGVDIQRTLSTIHELMKAAPNRDLPPESRIAM